MKEGIGKSVRGCGTTLLPLETKWKWLCAFKRLFWKATESLIPRKFMVRQGRKEEKAFIYQLLGFTEECVHPQGVNSKALKKKFFFNNLKIVFYFLSRSLRQKGSFGTWLDGGALQGSLSCAHLKLGETHVELVIDSSYWRKNGQSWA